MDKEIYKKEKYEKLTPANNIESETFDALEFAIKDKELNNIAITGKYSSGKTSIVKSFFRKENIDDYIDISLATFDKNTSGNIVKFLEETIVKKLYYSYMEKNEENKNYNIDFVLCIFYFVITVYVLYKFNNKIINNNIIFIGLMIAIMFGYIISKKIVIEFISFIKNKKDIQINVGNISFSTTKNNDESSLTKNFELIRHIIIEQEYKYVIFEDIDRYDNLLIFERLRDLNINLNSSGCNVKFIYLIRDDLFNSSERVKFFDFIIPIVPFVSIENSNEELIKMLDEKNELNNLDEDFITNISMYIIDIRILKNIVNEYIIYKKTLGKNIPNYNNLFAIIILKNISPKIFSIFESSKEKMVELINKKNDLLNLYKEELKSAETKLKEKTDEQLKEISNKNINQDLVMYKDLLKYLIENNYINEESNIYLNKFNGGKLSLEDYNYILKLRNNEKDTQNIKLYNPEEVMKRLTLKDIERDNIFNISLFDYILEDYSNEKESKFVNRLLESKSVIDYFIECLYNETFKNKKVLKRILIKNKYIMDNVFYRIEQNEEIHDNHKKIIKIFLNSITFNELKEYLEKKNVFEYCETKPVFKNIRLNKIKELNEIGYDFKFTNISYFKANNKVLKYIIKKNQYKINLENIKEIFSKYKYFLEENYNIICKNEHVKEYVNSNIREYIENVYSKLEKQKNTESSVVKMLNLVENEEDLVDIILNKEENKILNINRIENIKTMKKVFENNKCKYIKNNIIIYYENYGLDNVLKEKINKDFEIVDEFLKDIKFCTDNETFILDIVYDNDITNEVFNRILMENNNILINDYSKISGLSKDKIKLLIEYNKLKNIDSDIPMFINNFPDLLPTYIKSNNYYSSLYAYIKRKNVVFSIDIILLIVKSDLTDKCKIEFIEMIRDEDLNLNLIDSITAKQIAENLIKNRIEISESLLYELILKIDINQENLKIKLLNLYFEYISKENIDKYLEVLGPEYENIIIDRKKPKFVYNDDMKKLLLNIKNLNYKITYKFTKNNMIELSNTKR